MANTQMGSVNRNFVNSTRAVAAPDNTSSVATPLNYTSISALRARLTTLNASYYTAAKLDNMTVNDMVFAVRSIDDKTTIADYMPTSTA